MRKRARQTSIGLDRQAWLIRNYHMTKGITFACGTSVGIMGNVKMVNRPLKMAPLLVFSRVGSDKNKPM